MAANIHLMKVIQEMRAEIHKLEKENQALRMKLTLSSQRTPGSGGESGEEKEDTDLGNLEEVPRRSPAALHGVVATDSAPGVREHEGNVMIVRRYSISSPILSLAASDPWKSRRKHPNCGLLEVQGRVKSLVSSIKKQDNEEKMFTSDSFTTSGCSKGVFPEHGFGCRDKTKTVGFLLPMNMSSYSKDSSSLKYSPNQLSTILE
ncbi:putative coiled-coil domain-containing protein 195 [Cervus elaphus]|uniref:putative coiled-coil domain-containing protein 195 n=1 Tax=Cervus elaphus TaxID=9860 RepID=UPI001CC2E5FB|nr:putative coiled-coil domain-containing protein 195 [Cervus elaphus]